MSSPVTGATAPERRRNAFGCARGRIVPCAATATEGSPEGLTRCHGNTQPEQLSHPNSTKKVIRADHPGMIK